MGLEEARVLCRWSTGSLAFFVGRFYGQSDDVRYSFVRIALDARAYSWAGVGRYIRNLLRELALLDSGHAFTVLLNAEDAAAYERPRGWDIQMVEGSYYSWREQVVFWRQLARVRADLWHFPHFNIPYFFNRPYVVTVHDITRFIFPGQTDQRLLKQLVYEQVFRHAVEGARGVMCVSRATCRELRTLPVRLPADVSVTYEGVDQQFLAPVSGTDRQRVRLKIGTSEPYLLYVGVWMNHKNLPRLLEAYAHVVKEHRDLKLVMTGRPRPGYVAVDKLARRLGLSNDQIIYLGFVEHALLPALYAEAEALVLPSLYEGFGLPALEAAACGTPVVVSNVSSLPEIMGEAAAYANPESTSSIAAAVRSVLEDPSRGAVLSTLGRERSRRFSWRDCAEQTLALMERAKAH